MRLLTLISRIAGIMLLAFVAGIILSGFQPVMGQGLDEKEEKDDQEAIVIGDIPPDFTIVDMAGNEFTLSEMVGVKPVILDFWATWCGYCVASMPALNELNALYGDEVEIIGITKNEANKSNEEIEAFVEEHGITYRIIHDPAGDIAENYFVSGIPFFVVIGIDGIVEMTHSGYSDTLLEDLESVLSLGDERE